MALNRRTDCTHGNPLVSRWAWEKSLAQHQERVKKVKPLVDTRPPASDSYHRTVRRDYYAEQKKKMEEAFQNYKMIRNIESTMNRPLALPKAQPTHSLNETSRKSELLRIYEQNLMLLQRLEVAKPTCQAQRAEIDFAQHKQRLTNCSYSARRFQQQQKQQQKRNQLQKKQHQQQQQMQSQSKRQQDDVCTVETKESRNRPPVRKSWTGLSAKSPLASHPAYPCAPRRTSSMEPASTSTKRKSTHGPSRTPGVSASGDDNAVNTREGRQTLRSASTVRTSESSRRQARCTSAAVRASTSAAPASATASGRDGTPKKGPESSRFRWEDFSVYPACNPLGAKRPKSKRISVSSPSTVLPSENQRVTLVQAVQDGG